MVKSCVFFVNVIRAEPVVTESIAIATGRGIPFSEVPPTPETVTRPLGGVYVTAATWQALENGFYVLYSRAYRCIKY